MAKTAFATDARKRARFASALASPAGVLITIPLLVIGVGLAIMLLGRSTTRDASTTMASHQLAEQALSVQNDVAYALDQADPLLERLKMLAQHVQATDETLLRLNDLMISRPGVAFLSISLADGTFRGAQLVDGKIQVQESTVDSGKATWYEVVDDLLVPKKTEITHYDPRTRDFYKLAQKGERTWTEPYTFFKSHETGITCTEPVYDSSKQLAAVITVDFDVGALSAFIARPALDGARSIVFTRDGTVLAAPMVKDLPITDKVVRAADLKDPVLDALLADLTSGSRTLRTSMNGVYLAAVSAIGGKRAGVAVPLDWYVATVVPESALLGPSHRLLRGGIIASAGALLIAVTIGLVLAWNVVRMRRQVQAARTVARNAEARVREMGSYKLVARLGAGGMGEVWRAEHTLLARQAAIKLIRPEMMQDESAGEIRERFRREAQTLATMKSRHTIEIYDYGVTEAGMFYYVMELLDGLDLESLVVKYGPQPAARVIQLLVQACGSLAEAHDAGLLHRDIKPPNLFACRAADEVDICKLLDFGIVQMVNEPMPEVPASRASRPIIPTPKITQIGAMLGTPGFMPPEQILGMPLDGRADLYALGCVAWWLLTGREVFQRENEAKILHKHIYEPLPQLSQVMTTWCPPELEELIASMLAKDPSARPASARDLGDALRRIAIPEQYEWTREHAQIWWASYKPDQPVPNLPSGEVQRIMPGASAFDATVLGNTIK
ncbi:MAG: serine/threonine protein kinase [Kofleriaceae bacterium]